MTFATFAADNLDALSGYYRTNGFVVLRGLYTDGELDALQAECESVQEAVRRGDLGPEHGSAVFLDDAREGPTSAVHYVNLVTKVSPLARKASTHPLLVAAIKRVLGPCWLSEEGFGVVLQDARPGKESAYTRIGWHSDWQSGPQLGCWPSTAFTIHIDGTSPANGFLRVVPGSHWWATPAPAADVYGRPGPVGTDVTGGHSALPAPFPMPLGFEKVPGEVGVYCDRGDVILHDAYLWHSAARGTDDATTRRHLRGGWFAGADVTPGHGDNFVKNARR